MGRDEPILLDNSGSRAFKQTVDQVQSLCPPVFNYLGKGRLVQPLLVQHLSLRPLAWAEHHRAIVAADVECPRQCSGRT